MSKNNIFSSIIIIILLAGNIYLSVQYISASKQLQQVNSQSALTATVGEQSSLVLNEFLDVVLNTRGTKTSDDRIKLENDLRQLKDPALTASWDAFVASKDAKASQVNAMKVIGLLEGKITK